jgi:outer membrane biosynthesis protein TonB
VFDNIGKDLDEEANKRRAMSLFLTLAGLGAVVGLGVGITAYTAARVVMETTLADQMVELVEDVMDQALPPPPPPPPPPPAAADASEEEEVTEPEPDEMVEEVQELKEEVKEEIKSDVKPAGVEGGQEGGVEGGVVGGVQGGVEGGVLGGQLGGVKVFHHSELEVKKRVQPEYPEAAKALDLGDQRCLVKVFIDEEGTPYDAIVDTCPKVFHDAAKQAILKWRWYPPKDGKSRVKAQTTIAIIYKLSG